MRVILILETGQRMSGIRLRRSLGTKHVWMHHRLISHHDEDEDDVHEFDDHDDRMIMIGSVRKLEDGKSWRVTPVSSLAVITACIMPALFGRPAPVKLFNFLWISTSNSPVMEYSYFTITSPATVATSVEIELNLWSILSFFHTTPYYPILPHATKIILKKSCYMEMH